MEQVLLSGNIGAHLYVLCTRDTIVGVSEEGSLLLITEQHHHKKQLSDVHVMEPKQLEVREMIAGTSHEKGEGYSEEQLQFMLGLSLVLGFVFMLAVDQIATAHSHVPVSTGEPCMCLIHRACLHKCCK